MWISEIAERAIIAASASLDVTFRASRVDDEPASETERKEFPCMVIIASGGMKDTTESLFIDVPIQVSIITHYKDDPKCTTLAGLEDTFWRILEKKVDNSTLKPAFDAAAVAAGETRYYKGLTGIDSTPIDKTEGKQTITINMTMRTCGS